MIYILAQLIHRAETTDTVIIGYSNHREDLQDIILSLYEEILDEYNDVEFANYYVNKLNIVEVRPI